MQSRNTRRREGPLYSLAIVFIFGCGLTAAAQLSGPPNTQNGSSIGGTTNSQNRKVDNEVRPGAAEAKSNEPEILGLVGALSGAIIGGIIGWRASLSAVSKAQELAQQSEQQLEEKQNRAVRAMLGIEIDENLAMLREEATRTDLDTRPQDRSGIEWVAIHPLPRWSTAVWEQTVLLVHRALSIDEIVAVQGVYVSLQSLAVAREELSRVFLRQKSHADVEVFYDRAKELTSTLLATGNPLKPAILKDGSSSRS